MLFEQWDRGDKQAGAALVLFERYDGADKSRMSKLQKTTYKSGSSRFLWDEHIFVRQGKIADKREKIVIVAESITDSFGNFNLVIETFEFCGAYWM